MLEQQEQQILEAVAEAVALTEQQLLLVMQEVLV